MKAIVVGAGLAGLVSARTLRRAGWEVVVLEAADGIGGRVRTDIVDGFRLDRGFQTLFTAYPAAQRQLDLKALKLRMFDAGVIVVEGQRWNELGDPFKDPKAFVPTVLSSLPRVSDKLLVVKLRRELRRRSIGDILRSDDRAAGDFLRGYGFSRQFIELFFQGFLGAIFLDRSLATSSHRFQFDYKMLAEGRAGVPRDGMQAVPDQLAPGLDIRLNTPALRLLRAGHSVRGVQSPSEDFEADAVVVAAHSPEAERLSGIGLPKEANSATCLYYRLPHSLYGHKKIVLNGYPDGFVNSAVQISSVAPSYAPQPEHLLSATILGAPDLTLEQLSERALEDMQRWFPWRGIGGLRPLAAYQIPFARLSQPPGSRAAMPSNQTPVQGLYFAGEYTEASSIDGAMASGEKATSAILEDCARD